SGTVQSQSSVDMRYQGQGFELSVPYSARSLSDFHREHQRRYGYSTPAAAVELVTIRLRTWIPSKAEAAALTAAAGKKGSPIQVRTVFAGRSLPTKVVDRDRLSVGAILQGPAIIAEYSATTFVPL